MSVPTFDQLIPEDAATISEIQRKATEKGYELLTLINSKAEWGKPNGDRYLQIATSESLTCGLIMSTLVDIPWAGFIKYGGFGVYDPDAKRVFNHVSVDNVYTHKCAAEMAIGVLKNSNATLAIAVTGNAMPLNHHVDMLGEVFIGIAGYNDNGDIIYVTNVINMCNDGENTFDSFKKTCDEWYKKITVEQTHNARTATATISKEIRYYTVYKAYQQCIKFINDHNPSVPDAILERKKQNESKSDIGIHTTIPNNKFDFGGDGICVNANSQGISECKLSGVRGSKDEKIALYQQLAAGQSAGKKSKKTTKNKRSSRLRSYKRRR
jgi:nicotinamide mononucleotide (NMN) deamidase PncC